MTLQMKEWRWLSVLVLILANVTAVEAQTPEFIFENSKKPHVARTDEALELRAGPGWLRIPRVFQGFELRFEFKLLTPATAGTLEMRTWPQVGEGRQYIVSLRDAATAGPAPTLFTGAAVAARVLRTGEPHKVSMTEWHKVLIRREAGEVSIFLNDVLAGAYEADQDPATMLLRTAAGTVKIRRVAVSAVSQPSIDLWATLARPGQTGLISPSVVHEEKPKYTSDAMRRRVEGIVEVEAIVLNDGSVGDVRVIRSLDSQLDQQGASAVHRWRFKPARINGQPVRSVVSVELTFTLRK